MALTWIGRTIVRFSYRLGAMLLFGIAIFPPFAQAQDRPIVATVNVSPMPLSEALKLVAQQTGGNILYTPSTVAGIQSRGVSGRMTAQQAVNELLQDTGLDIVPDGNGGLLIQRQIRPDPVASALPVEEVIITGSRLMSNARAPKPGTILTRDQLASLSPQSIPAGLAKLPVFAPVRGSDSVSDGGYQPTGNYLDIYGLGAIRTLVLMDGHRVTSTYYDGTVDINTIPQMLMQRVEIVTSGAAAVYGSDAVSGVVNFILNKNFNGLMGQFQGGTSTWGDARSFRLGLAGGTHLTNWLHFEASVEFFSRDIIPADPRPYGLDATSLVGSGTATAPYQSVTNTRSSNAPFGGLITTGPLAGQQFAPDGTLVPFSQGIATSTNGVAVGGDGGYKKPSFVLPSLQTSQAFARFDYNFDDNITGYLQASYSHTRTRSHQQNLISTAGSNAITIYSGNPYLKPEYQFQLTSARTPSFNLARYNEDFGGLLNLTNRTTAQSMNTGLQGTALDRFIWEIFYTHGEGRMEQVTRNNVNTERMYAALDAVTDSSTGNITCRASITAPNAFPGCVPMNVLGNGTPSETAIDYVSGETRWKSINTLDDFGANITGTVFDNWAGPVKMALGAEYRLQRLAITSSVTDNTFDISNLRVGLNGSTPSTGSLKWTKNVSVPMRGENSVYEANLEIQVPLLRDLPLIQALSVNGASRSTQYSTSGWAQTWRLGVDWQIWDDLRFRGARSSDIRAPTLYDLFQSQSATISGLSDFLTGSSGELLNNTGGNLNLVPEVARNTTAGLAYAPDWLSNFTASVDYYHIAINNAVAVVVGSAPQTQQICIASGGASPLCALLVRPYPITNTTPANYPTLNYNAKQNLALNYAEGIDMAINYTADLTEMNANWGGTLGLRLMWSHQPTLKSQTLPGSTFINAAGTSQTPKDRITLQAEYVNESFAITAIQRYYGSIHLTGNPTLFSANSIPPYWQTDLNLSYDLNTINLPSTVFLNINNAFNQFGGNCCAFPSTPGMQYPVAPFTDRIGRYFVLGLRFSRQ